MEVSKPIIILGLGEIGIKILKSLKYQIGEAIPTTNDNKIQFMGIGAHRLAREKAEKEEAALWDKEYLYMGGFVADLSDERFQEIQPYIRDWFPTNLRGFFIDDGPKFLSPIGRLAVFYKYDILIQRLHSLVKAALKSSSTEDAQSQKLKVFMVSPLYDGIGSGMFLDIAYLMQKLAGENNCELAATAYLLLPPFDKGALNVEMDLMKVNAYSALTCLDSFFKSSEFRCEYPQQGELLVNKPPFNVCYLVQAGGEEEQSSNFSDDIIKSISTGILMEVALNLSSKCDALDNPLPDAYRENSTFYGTFGINIISVPVDKILLLIAKKLATEIIDDMRRPPIDAEEDINHLVDEFMAEAQLNPEGKNGIFEKLNLQCPLPSNCDKELVNMLDDRIQCQRNEVLLEMASFVRNILDWTICSLIRNVEKIASEPIGGIILAKDFLLALKTQISFTLERLNKKAADSNSQLTKLQERLSQTLRELNEVARTWNPVKIRISSVFSTFEQQLRECRKCQMEISKTEIVADLFASLANRIETAISTLEKLQEALTTVRQTFAQDIRETDIQRQMEEHIPLDETSLQLIYDKIPKPTKEEDKNFIKPLIGELLAEKGEAVLNICPNKLEKQLSEWCQSYAKSVTSFNLLEIICAENNAKFTLDRRLQSIPSLLQLKETWTARHPLHKLTLFGDSSEWLSVPESWQNQEGILQVYLDGIGDKLIIYQSQHGFALSAINALRDWEHVYRNLVQFADNPLLCRIFPDKPDTDSVMGHEQTGQMRTAKQAPPKSKAIPFADVRYSYEIKGKLTADALPVFISQDVLNQIGTQKNTDAINRKGLLLGNLYQDRKIKYIEITGSAPISLLKEIEPVSREGEKNQNELNRSIVGWYHISTLELDALISEAMQYHAELFSKEDSIALLLNPDADDYRVLFWRENEIAVESGFFLFNLSEKGHINDLIQ